LFDMETLEAQQRYKILTATVTPRPIAWVTTLSEDGRPTKAKLTVPSGPAKLTLTFYTSVPSAAFPSETWLPPKP